MVGLAGCSNEAPAAMVNTNDRAAIEEPQLDTTPPSIPSDALKASVSDDDVRAFYERMQWKGLWSPATTTALDQALGSRIRNGLDRVDYGKVDDSMSPADRDVARTKAALSYAKSLARGRVDPSDLHEVYTLQESQVDVAAGLAQALEQNQVAHFFAGLVPQDDDYRRLSEAYVRYAREGRQASSSKLDDKDTIHVGDRDPRVSEIARQLAANGYLSQDNVPAGGEQAAQYTQPIAEGVKRLQADYGIKTDGLFGGDTLAVINIGPADKARALAVALERRRWLSRTPPATRIDVNAAAATLDYHRDGKLVDQRRVIVGQPDRETPPLGSPLYRLVANPTWTVPKSIEVSSATVRAKNMHKVNGYWVQPSGPDNALGLVKFDMQNKQAIYLHDTSDKSLFDRTQRDLSHGCVRVQDALGFAQMIAQQEGVADKWKQARASGEQTFVDLPAPIPVRLLYQNAFIDKKGEVVFRTDPYGWNDTVARRLGFDGGAAKKARSDDIDLGP